MLGGVESLRISLVGQTVLARLMESQIWHQPTGSVGGRAQQWDNGLCSPRCQTLQFLPVCHWCPLSCHPGVGTQRERVGVGESVCGFPKRSCLGLQQPSPPIQSLLVFTARYCGDLSSWHWKPGLGSLMWVWDSLFLIYSSRIFIHVGVGPVRSTSAPLLPV